MTASFVLKWGTCGSLSGTFGTVRLCTVSPDERKHQVEAVITIKLGVG